MKRILSLVLAFGLIAVACMNGVTSFAVTSKDASKNKFYDLKYSPYEKAVAGLVEKGIINGYEDNSFRPLNNITRAECSVMITKAMNPGDEKLNSAPEGVFNDMTSSYDWAKKYVNYAKIMGVIHGYPNGDFIPANKVTYNELSAMIINGMGYKDVQLPGIWPVNYRDKAVELGLYSEIFRLENLQDKEAFNYDAPATRGSAALMISAGLEALEKRGQDALPAVNEGGEIIETPPYDDGRYDWIDGEAVELSLEDAVEYMKTESFMAETAELNKKKDKATAQGYGDSVKAMNDALKILKVPGIDISVIAEMQKNGITKENVAVLRIQRDFANANIETNYEASINAIEYQTVSIYYGIIQAEENLRVSMENLEVQKTLLKNVRAKFNVGAATNLEVSSQESAVSTAEENINSAKIMLEQLKMNFNLMMGNDVTTNLKLTTELELVPEPDMKVDEAVESALENRLDFDQMNYGYEVQKAAFNAYKGYNSSKSASYKEQENALAMTQLAIANLPKNIEIEIRNKYIDLNKKHDAIESAEETLALTKEVLRVKTALYDVGMATFADVQQAQYNVFQTNQLIMKSIADYNIGVYELKYAVGVGKERIDL